MKIEYKPNPYHRENIAVITFDNPEEVFESAAIFFSQYEFKGQTLPEITVRDVQTTGPNWNEIPEGYNVFAVDCDGRGSAFRETPNGIMGTFLTPDFDSKHIGEFPLSMYGIQYRPGYEPK